MDGVVYKLNGAVRLNRIYLMNSEWNKVPKQTRKSLQKEYEELRIRFARLQQIIQASPTDSLTDEDFDIQKFRWAYWIVRSRWIDCNDSYPFQMLLLRMLKIYNF